MSALPPKADIAQHDGNVRFGPISDIGNLFGNLFDHLVGAGEQRLRDGEFEYQIRSLTELRRARCARESIAIKSRWKQAWLTGRKPDQ
jgi:hypothetical protein